MSFDTPKAPAAPPPPPDYAAAERSLTERSGAERRQRKALGRGATILTSEEGVEKSNTAQRVLLGE